MDWVSMGLKVLEKLPIERLIVKSRHAKTDVEIMTEVMSQRLPANTKIALSSPEIVSEKTPIVSKTEPIVAGPTTDETIEYQRKEIAKHLLQLREHLSQGCKIMGKPCDCCQKHSLTLEALALETYGMSPDPIYQRLAEWAREVQSKTGPEVVNRDFGQDALTARDLWKKLGLRLSSLPEEKPNDNKH